MTGGSRAGDSGDAAKFELAGGDADAGKSAKVSRGPASPGTWAGWQATTGRPQASVLLFAKKSRRQTYQWNSQWKVGFGTKSILLLDAEPIFRVAFGIDFQNAEQVPIQNRVRLTENMILIELRSTIYVICLNRWVYPFFIAIIVMGYLLLGNCHELAAET